MTAVPAPTPSDQTQLQWRVFPPYWTPGPPTEPSPDPGPCVLLIHGGAFAAGSTFQPDVDQVAETIANAGYWVFVGDYRLAPCGRIYPNQPAHLPTPTPGSGPTPTPDPSGRPPEQTDDVMSQVLAIRNSVHCNGKVGILGASSGGTLAAYAGLYRSKINTAGRPAWDGGADGVRDDRPDCVVTFSSLFDLSDQLESDNRTDQYPSYIPAVQNYIGTCDRSVARTASPVALVDSGTAARFKPMYMVHCDQDRIAPYRQLSDGETAFLQASVCPDNFIVARVIDPNGRDGGSYGMNDHALALWVAPDPSDPLQTVGQAVLNFLDANLK